MRALSVEAETGNSWIPGLALLARNAGRGVFVIPAQPVPSPYWGAGIQGVCCRISILFLSSVMKQSMPNPEIASSLLAPGNDNPVFYAFSVARVLSHGPYRRAHLG